MRPTFPNLGKRPRFPTVKLKSRRSEACADVLSTSLLALKESADAFPPLKSVVGSVLVLWDIAEGAKLSKAEARGIARRTETILKVIADAVPDPSSISAPMQLSINRFIVLLDEIRTKMERICLSGRISRVIHLNRNQATLREIKSQLDDAYSDVLAASILRGETQREEILGQQAIYHQHTHSSIKQLKKQILLSQVVILFGEP
ncbi:hypothetical protein B0H16DRAFT_845256 [Mycena metata]|uniref:Uncharacterized protein n=1 Tax=Mycena metata TaxID=1033252 RepID=A0AAD7IWH8_9AGAR|nr:hypothetical protein B0H16DRAFT_845256 [Mycena metata]